MSQNDTKPKICVCQEKENTIYVLAEKMQSMYASSIESSRWYEKQAFLEEVATFPPKHGPDTITATMRHSIHFWAQHQARQYTYPIMVGMFIPVAGINRFLPW